MLKGTHAFLFYCFKHIMRLIQQDVKHARLSLYLGKRCLSPGKARLVVSGCAGVPGRAAQVVQTEIVQIVGAGDCIISWERTFWSLLRDGCELLFQEGGLTLSQGVLCNGCNYKRTCVVKLLIRIREITWASHLYIILRRSSIYHSSLVGQGRDTCVIQVS